MYFRKEINDICSQNITDLIKLNAKCMYLFSKGYNFFSLHYINELLLY